MDSMIIPLSSSFHVFSITGQSALHAALQLGVCFRGSFKPPPGKNMTSDTHIPCLVLVGTCSLTKKY